MKATESTQLSKGSEDASNYVHVHETCPACRGCIYECEHRVKTTVTATGGDKLIVGSGGNKTEGKQAQRPQSEHNELSPQADLVLRIMAVSQKWGFEATSKKAIAEAYEILSPALAIQKQALIKEFKGMLIDEGEKRSADTAKDIYGKDFTLAIVDTTKNEKIRNDLRATLRDGLERMNNE